MRINRTDKPQSAPLGRVPPGLRKAPDDGGGRRQFAAHRRRLPPCDKLGTLAAQFTPAGPTLKVTLQIPFTSLTSPMSQRK